MRLQNNLKKLFVMLIVFTATLGFVACTKEDQTAEALQTESIFLGDLNVLTADVELPTTTSKFGFTITWKVECDDNSMSIVEKDGKTYAKVNRLDYTENEDGEEVVRWGEGTLIATITNKSGSRDFEFAYGVRSKEKVLTGLNLLELKQANYTFQGEEIVAKGMMIEAKGTVIGLTGSGFYINDETASFYVYVGSKPTVAVGDVVTVVGMRDTYYNLPQIAKSPAPVITVEKNETIDVKALAKETTIAGLLALDYDTDHPENFTVLVKVSGRVTVEDDVYYLTDELTAKKTRFETSYSLTDAAETELEGLVDKYVELYCMVYDYHSSYKVPRLGFLEGLATEITAPVLTDEVRANNVKEQLISEFDNIKVYGDIELPTTSSLYEGMTIAWTSNNAAVLTNEGVYAEPAQPTEVTLTATITIGEETATAEITVSVERLQTLSVTDALKKAKGETIRVTGVVTTLIYNGLYITDGTSTILLYQPADNTAEVGDTIVATGTKGEYNGCIQLGQGCTVEVNTEVAKKTNAEIIAMLNATEATVEELVNKEYTNEDVSKVYKVTGTLSKPEKYAFALTVGENAITTIKNVGSEGTEELEALANKEVTMYIYVYSTSSSSTLFTYIQGTATERELTDAEKVAATKETLENIFNEYNGFENLELPTELNDTTITWVSNKPEVVANDGVVTMPSENTEVKLTATIELAGQTSVNVEVTLTVKTVEVTTIAQAIAAIDAATDGVTVAFVGKVIGLTCDDYAYIADSTAVIYVKANGFTVDKVVKVIGNGTVWVGYNDEEYTRQVSAVYVNEESTEEITVMANITDLDATKLAGVNNEGDSNEVKLNKEALKTSTVLNKAVELTAKVKVGPDTKSYMLEDTNGNSLFSIYRYSVMFNNTTNDENEFTALDGVEVEVKGFVIGYNVESDVYNMAVTSLVYDEADIPETPDNVLKLSHTSTTTVNMTGENDANTYFGLDANEYTVTSNEGEKGLHIGLNKAGDVRLYGVNSTNGNIFSFSCKTKTIVSIKINFTASTGAFVSTSINGSEITAVDGVYAINGSSFVIINKNASTDQVKFTSIEITFAE